MHRRPSILTHRPKTSSAVDEDSAPKRLGGSMKRTASQTFSNNYHDVRDGGVPLDAVKEGMRCEYPSSHPSHSSSRSLSRAAEAIAGSFTRQRTRRRLSTSAASSSSSGRRPSIHGLFEFNPLSTRKPSSDQNRLPLQHHDSGFPAVQQHDTNLTPILNNSSTLNSNTNSRPTATKTLLKRFSSLRRKPAPVSATTAATAAAAGPSSDFANYTLVPPPRTSSYPNVQLPGSAARQAAAAANNDRQNQLRREQEQTRRFLTGSLPASVSMEEVIKDNESGVGMTCSLPIIRSDSVQEKKMSDDPFRRLPAELAAHILSNLDAESLARTEQVSKGWNEIASSPHVWRDVFLRTFQPEVHVQPVPIQMGGAGIGTFHHDRPAPAQDWKSMYQARKSINKQWKLGVPAAIYLNGHTDSVYCCQFDENKCITGSRDRTIRVWDMKTYKCIRVIGGPNHRPQPNSPPPLEERPEKVISYPSMNGTAEGNSIFHVPADYHDASILCLQYDNQIMVTGSSDHTCIVWDITGDNYIPLHRLRGHQAGVLDVCLDDKYIISCSKDSLIMVWDRQTGDHLRTLRGHRGPVNAVQLRGNLLVSASGDGVAKLWNLDSGASIKDFPSEDRGLAAVEFSDDAKYVLAGGNDHVVYKFDAATGRLIHSNVRHAGLVRSLFLDAFNGRIVSGSYDQSIRVSDYATGQCFACYDNWTTSWILSAKSDYRRVVATSQDGRALILDFGHKVMNNDLLVNNQ